MNREVEGILLAQYDLHGRISRAFENLKKTGSSKLTLGVVEARLQSLEVNWAKFETHQDQLLKNYWASISDHDYVKQNVPQLAEEAFLHQKGLFLDLIRSHRPSETAGSSTTRSDPGTQTPRTTLPRIQLPQFSGKYEDWPSFRDLFKSIIGRDSSTTPVEKLHYLKTCLKGEAELLVRNLATTDENYERAWKVLSAYYENKRLLVRAYLSNFLSLQKMKSESAILSVISSSEDLFLYLAVELLDPRSRREWENFICDTVDPPSYETFEQFLDRRLHTLEAMQPAKTDSSASKASNGAPKATRSHLARKQETRSDSKRGRCSLCQKDHFLMLCEEYRQKTAQGRKQHVEANSLCLNCLGRHKVSECASKKACTVCSARHHSSLHDACRVADVATSSHVAQKPVWDSVSVLLATARVRVADRYGEWHTARALIDQGSESSMITERLAQKLRVARSPVAVAVYGIGGHKTGVAKGQVILSLSPRNGGPSMSVAALVLPRITAYAGKPTAGPHVWPHIQGLDLADPDYCSSDPVDILLGADVHTAILAPDIRKGDVREPMAQKTSLGWVLSGAVGNITAGQHAHAHQSRIEDDLAGLVRRFWEQEETPVDSRALSKAEQDCEDYFTHTHARRSDGRYVVRLPVIEPLPELSGTRRAASRLLKHMENKFKREEKFHALYRDFMSEYIDLRHMSLVSSSVESNQSRVSYLPHHGVLREASSTTKLRVVFNGSTALPTGASLNRHLMIGPNLLPALSDILLMWRRHRFVIATDIEKMYRQIDVHPLDRDLQRILWREGEGNEIAEYQLNTVTYGLACAPFLAIRTLRQLADDEADRWPAGAAVLRRNVYMDDILAGASTVDEAKNIQEQLVQICKAGGFPLKKWSANNAALLQDVAVEDRLQREPRWWLPGESHSTLGLRWHPHDDDFAFSAQIAQIERFTKRTVLSLAARLFDPLGWLAPTSVRAKILIQSTWLLGVDWDDPLPDTDAQRWLEFQAELPRIEEIRVPRWLGSEAKTRRRELHDFADASERAYAAVLYQKTIDNQGEIEVRLVAAKTKVAPLKQVTLPRLELCAAALLARLVVHTRRVLEATEDPLHLWSDSTVALGWIRGHPSSWKTYVANRVSEIQTSLPDAVWHHIPGRDNPADCASRGLSPSELVNHSLWWNGPPWLRSESKDWPALKNDVQTEGLPEQRTQIHAVTIAEEEEDEPALLKRYSSLHRLLRITAWCRRWLSRNPVREHSVHERTAGNVSLVLRADELEDARRSWIRIIQAGKFKTELKAIESGRALPKGSVLTKLSPFRDCQGILRVGGRLKNVPLPHDEKHPIILPGDSTFTRLVIEACHRRALHGGVQLTLGSIRQEFWIPRGRMLVKNSIHRCLPCLRWRAATPQPPMGNLPPARVTPARPFLNTGVDYAGPVWLRTSKGRGHKATKAFIAVFVCLSSRAVHLEVASDYSTDAFLAALHRFVARRGLCRDIYSDCGTNFVGADTQLKALFSASHREGRAIAARLAEDRIQWHFNPPAAPNFGGIWEAAVKSTKHHLRRVIGDATLTYEEMATLLSQVEACLNSRPLQALSDDPEDLTALTPGHFLIGAALNAVPEPSLAEERTSRLSRWQLLQQMRDHFWERWSREYIHSLAHRSKWIKADEEVRVGRLCLLMSETSPPTKWPLARVEQLHPGDDGHVRVVAVRTASSHLTRPVNKLVLLPTSSSPNEET